ncbi:hypothetical protein K491DRAFT_691536 [Lophiostoma macrostomum CBS 122681]|uniref:Uncharacterized protein n=1 Tax=Lophiostoma macrostomum CBS 122681 TaxID=1314788 RepID=A0A6A6TAN1_9PLEO|nr:hypothetical protein K491DRAFT_691536 [Lophiostoma macrostomum CBS 122681]
MSKSSSDRDSRSTRILSALPTDSRTAPHRTFHGRYTPHTRLVSSSVLKPSHASARFSRYTHAMRWTSLAALAALQSAVLADVEFTSPKAGDTLDITSPVDIEWTDSNSGVALADLTTYNLFLCAGGNDDGTYKQLYTLTQTGPASFSTGSKMEQPFDKTLGASTPKNAYFFMMQSVAAKGGTVTNFSKRFTLSGMTGAFDPVIISGMKDVTGNDGPATIDTTNDAAAGASSVPADSIFDVAYTMQTGLTRYAPMQPIPPTKITKKDNSPQHPTSGFTVAQSFLPIPSIQTTITQSQTFSVSSRQNTVAAAAMPTDDMAKFLARWKD